MMIIKITWKLKRQWQIQVHPIIVMHFFFVKRTITVPKAAAEGEAVNNTN